MMVVLIVIAFIHHNINESYPHLSFTFSDVCCVIAQCRILKAALHKVGSNIVTYVMNPKAMPRHHLLGHIDMDTRESFDGVLTYSSRQVGMLLPSFSFACFVSATKFLLLVLLIPTLAPHLLQLSIYLLLADHT